VKSIVEERIGKGFLHYPDFMLNYCAKYHEVDYKMAGYTKEWDWFKYTPVVAAAKNGHIECVRVLLLNGACPVLQCCEIDDVCEDALQAASGKGWGGNSMATGARRAVAILQFSGAAGWQSKLPDSHPECPGSRKEVCGIGSTGQGLHAILASHQGPERPLE